MDICTNIVNGTLTNHIEFDIKPVLTKYIFLKGIQEILLMIIVVYAVN